MSSVMPNAFTTCSFVLATAIHSAYAELQYLFKQSTLTIFTFVNLFQPCFLDSSETLGRFEQLLLLTIFKEECKPQINIQNQCCHEDLSLLVA